MFCHLLLWLGFGLMVVSPVTWPPVPRQSTKGLIPCYPPHAQGVKATPNVGHMYITLSIFRITLCHTINMIMFLILWSGLTMLSSSFE